MRAKWVASAAVCALIVGVSAASAQKLSLAREPAEFPPASYTGKQYVDSRGCIYVRAGLGGQTAWVPRVTKDRMQVCGATPTFAPKPAVVAAAPAEVAAKPAKRVVMADRPRAARAPKGPLMLVAVRDVAWEATLCPGNGRGDAQRYLLSDGRRVTQCGAAVSDPVAFINGLGVEGLMLEGADLSPAAAARAEALGARGYVVAWSNGPLRSGGGEAPVATGGGIYVQVGAFAVPANADNAAAVVADLGLPVTTAPTGGLNAVLAGPFADGASAAAARAQLREAGFIDAFYRR